MFIERHYANMDSQHPIQHLTQKLVFKVTPCRHRGIWKWCTKNCSWNSASVPWYPVKSGRQSFSEVEKNSFNTLPGKGGSAWADALKTVYPALDKVVRGFIEMVQRGRRDLFMDTLLIGWQWGNRESASSTFWFQQVWGLLLVSLLQLTTSTRWGFQSVFRLFCRTVKDIVLCIP